LRRRNLLLFAISGGKGKPAITNHPHDHVDHVSIRQQSQQLAGEDAVPHGVVGCCEVDKHSSGLIFSWKAILDVLCQQGDLVYGWPPLPKDCLVLRKQWADDWFGTGVDESLEDFKADAQQRCGTVALWVSNSGKKESNPGGFPGFRRLKEASSTGLKSSEILWPSVSSISRTAACWWSWYTRSSQSCVPVLHELEGDRVCRDGHRQEERPDLPVSLLMVLQALRLECEKSMELTASSHLTWFLASSHLSWK